MAKLKNLETIMKYGRAGKLATQDDLISEVNSTIEHSDFSTQLSQKAKQSDLDTTNTNVANKVDKVTGKGLSTNDYDNNAVAQVALITNKANTVDLNTQKARIDTLVATANSSFYQKSTSGTTGALLVVSSGATTGQINLASVTPVATGYTPVAGDYVLLVYGVANGSAELIDARNDAQGITSDNIANRINAFENGIQNGSRTLFLKWIQGKTLSGVENDTDTASIKNYGYIKVAVGDTVNFTIISGYQFRINYYDINMNYISMSSYYTTNQSITMQYPYFKVYIIKSDFSVLSISASSNITITLPYHFKTKDEVEIARKSENGSIYNSLQEHLVDIEKGNLLENDSILPRKMSFIYEVYEMINQSQITIGSILSDGTINTGVTTVYHTGYVKVKPNTKYVYQYFNEIGHIAFYDVNKNIISSGGYTSYDGQMSVGNIGYLITGSNTYYIQATSYGTDYSNMSLKLNANKTEMKDIYIDSKYLLNFENTNDSGEIACIGDSLTYGSGSTNTNGYPYILASLTGKTCNKLGFPADTSREICGYVSAMPLLVKEGITIPTSGSVTVELLDYNENGINIAYQAIAEPNINPVTIAGIEGELTLTLSNNDTSGSNNYIFTRSINGTAVDITYPIPMFTNCGTVNKNDIFIICIGQNGGYDSINEYISQVDFIINHQGLITKKYIIVGIPAQDKTNLGTLEQALLLKYGRNFINMRDYLVRQGLQDCGITPTAQDNADISVGKPPTSLRTDTVHFNDQGYNVIANQIYKRGKELGYW